MEFCADQFDHLETFAKYKPSVDFEKMGFSPKKHHNIVEASSLAYIKPPQISYISKIPKDIVNSSLSDCQFEAVCLISQKHEEILSDKRSGFFLGDSAGLGKGRIIVGSILENRFNQRNKSIWVTLNTDLFEDCVRDFRALDLNNKFIKPFKVYPTIHPSDLRTPPIGTMLITYSSLASSTVPERRQAIYNWFNQDTEGDGLIIFDESHRAKGDEKTSVGIVVKEIHDNFKNARILYSSATGFYKPEQMKYMTRLQIWNGSPFFDQETFIKTMNKRGLSAMECLACELKESGFYLSRQLSLEGVEAEFLYISEEKKFFKSYNKLTKFWCILYKHLKELYPNNKGKMSMYWANHQTFFYSLITSSKIQQCVQLARNAGEIYKKNSVVFGIQKTGDARFIDTIKNNEELNNHFSLAGAIIVNTLKTVFHYDVSSLFEDGNHKDKKLKGNHDPLPIFITDKYYEIKKYLPTNPLNDLISQLGGYEKVAEMTGRKFRPCLESDGSSNITKRKTHTSDRESNLTEQKKFQDGEKIYAVISDAASTGMSLHAEGVSSLKRLHITLELPWSAEKFIQQMGRTHRTNQNEPPKYLVPVSPIPAEIRFSWAISERLGQMGAITQGDRRASKKQYVTNKVLDTELGTKAMKAVLDYFSNSSDSSLESKKIISESLSSVGLLVSHAGEFSVVKNKLDIRKFFNRLLGVQLEEQKIVIDLFFNNLNILIRKSVEEKTYNAGVLDFCVPSLSCTYILSTFEFEISNKKILMSEVRIDYGLSFKRLKEITKNFQKKRFYIVQHNSKSQIFFLFTKDECTYTIQPNDLRIYSFTRWSKFLSTFPQNHKQTLNFNDKIAENLWEFQYKSMQNNLCAHFYLKNACITPDCEIGNRIRYFYIVRGSFNSIWEDISEISGRNNLQIVRLKTEEEDIFGILVSFLDGQKIIEKFSN